MDFYKILIFPPCKGKISWKLKCLIENLKSEKIATTRFSRTTRKDCEKGKFSTKYDNTTFTPVQKMCQFACTTLIRCQSVRRNRPTKISIRHGLKKCFLLKKREKILHREFEALSTLFETTCLEKSSNYLFKIKFQFFSLH